MTNHPNGTIERQTNAAYTGDIVYVTDRGVDEGAYLVSLYIRLTESEFTVQRIDGTETLGRRNVLRETVRNPLVHETPLDYRAVAQDILDRLPLGS